LILVRGLLAEARRRIVTAVSTDDSAGYRIIVASSGVESAAKGSADFQSASDLLNFLIAQKAGAETTKHTICFHGTLLSCPTGWHYRSREKGRISEKPTRTNFVFQFGKAKIEIESSFA
jgi:hypothetical protein